MCDCEPLSQCNVGSPLRGHYKKSCHFSFTLIIFHLGQLKIAQCIHTIKGEMNLTVSQERTYTAFFECSHLAGHTGYIYTLCKVQMLLIKPDASTILKFVSSCSNKVQAVLQCGNPLLCGSETTSFIVCKAVDSCLIGLMEPFPQKQTSAVYHVGEKPRHGFCGFVSLIGRILQVKEVRGGGGLGD